MKKILLLISLVFLVGCSAAPSAEEASSADSTDLTAMLTEKDGAIAVLEYQVEDLTDQLASLQAENETLLVASEGQSEEAQPSGFLCEDGLDNMRYDSAVGTIAIIEGWFAVQPFVQEMQGTYSVSFWNDVNSRIHTIRYISTEDGLTTTDSFLIMFEEAGWQPGVLWMTESCWLDYPY